MIRSATETDIAAVLAMGRRFFDRARWSEIAEWDDESVAMTLRHLIASDDGILLVAEEEAGLVGMAGALLCPFYFNRAHKTGSELFWWCESAGLGVSLLDALEREARARGALSFAMLSVDGLRSAALDRLYRRRGYRAAEHTYIRRL